MTTTARLKLPVLTDAQASKYVTINQMMTYLDALVQISVVNATTTAAPILNNTTDAGKEYIIAASATGIWSGKATQIAYWDGVAWWYFVPTVGWQAYNQGTSAYVKFNGTAWV